MYRTFERDSRKFFGILKTAACKVRCSFREHRRRFDNREQAWKWLSYRSHQDSGLNSLTPCQVLTYGGKQKCEPGLSNQGEATRFRRGDQIRTVTGYDQSLVSLQCTNLNWVLQQKYSERKITLHGVTSGASASPHQHHLLELLESSIAGRDPIQIDTGSQGAGIKLHIVIPFFTLGMCAGFKTMWNLCAFTRLSATVTRSVRIRSNIESNAGLRP